jgi:hypothetical protein
MLTVQEILSSVDKLSVDDREYLFEVLRRRRIEEQRAEILANAQEVIQAFKEGTAKVGTVDDLLADLLRDGD